MPILSIIVPVYNAEKTIKKCLDSILSQTLKDIEIILVNDFSNDKTIEIIENYKDERIVLINNEENKKTGLSRNIGLSKANGKYIGFVDNDDWVDEDYFEKMINEIEKNQDDICVTLKIKNHTNKKIKPHLSLNKDLKEVVFVERTAPWAKIFKKDFLIENNILFDNHRGEDIYPAFLSAYLTDKICSIKNSNYNCNIRINSVSHKKINEEDLEEIRVYKKILSKVNDKYWLKLIKKRAFISFEFLYNCADKNLKKELIKEFELTFNKKFSNKEYLFFKISRKIYQIKTFLRALV